MRTTGENFDSKRSANRPSFISRIDRGAGGKSRFPRLIRKPSWRGVFSRYTIDPGADDMAKARLESWSRHIVSRLSPGDHMSWSLADVTCRRAVGLDGINDLAFRMQRPKLRGCSANRSTYPAPAEHSMRVHSALKRGPPVSLILIVDCILDGASFRAVILGYSSKEFDKR